MSSEYNNNTVSGNGCSYATLGSYNGSYSMNTKPTPNQVSGVYVVPSWGAPGYDTLVSSMPLCGGYNNIESAYGKDADNCSTKYVEKSCQ